MRHTKTLLTALAFAGSLAGSAIAAEDGILSKVSAADENYCHMRFPAIKEETLWGNNPQLKDSSSGDMIDFYGPCDESPTSADQVKDQQRRYEERLDHDND